MAMRRPRICPAHIWPWACSARTSYSSRDFIRALAAHPAETQPANLYYPSDAHTPGEASRPKYRRRIRDVPTAVFRRRAAVWLESGWSAAASRWAALLVTHRRARTTRRDRPGNDL